MGDVSTLTLWFEMGLKGFFVQVILKLQMSS